MKSCSKYTIASLSCLIATIAVISCARADEVDSLVRSMMAKQRIPGACVAVVQNGKVVKAQAYGFANTEQKIPVELDTIFRLSSVSKQFTAAGIMILVQDGKITLDDPITRYLEGAPAAWEKIRVRHLLTQTSGLKDFVNDLKSDLLSETTDEKLKDLIAAQPLSFEPGDSWDYSNSNYHLLAMIIRKVSGQAYGDFLAARIFKPLGMTNTAVMPEVQNAPGHAAGYTLDKSLIRRNKLLARAVTSNGAGGIVSTVLDMARWDAALSAEKILTRETLTKMWSPVKLNGGTTHAYGFGWEIGEIANHRRISHSGKWTGFAAQIDRFVDDQLTVIFLSNLAESAPQKITRAVAGTYLPAVAPPVYKPIPDTEPTVTARFFEVLRRSAEGGLQKEDFTPEIWAALEPRMEQMRRDMTAIGGIKKLTLVERSEQDGDASYRYQAEFNRTTFIFHFVVTKSGQISLMMPEEVNQ